MSYELRGPLTPALSPRVGEGGSEPVQRWDHVGITIDLEVLTLARSPFLRCAEAQ